MKKKLCIIGAGLSGLTAGRNILSLTNTIDITIIEKSFKVSGRATSRLIKGYLFDSGATTINEINHPLLNPIFKNLDIKKIQKDIYILTKDNQIIQSKQKNEIYYLKDGVISIGESIQKDLESKGVTFQMQQKVIKIQEKQNLFEVFHQLDTTHPSQEQDNSVISNLYDYVLITIPGPQAAQLIDVSQFENQNYKQNMVQILNKFQYNQQLSILIGISKKIEKQFYALVNLDKENSISWLNFESDKRSNQQKTSIIVQMNPSFSEKEWNTSKKLLQDIIIQKLNQINFEFSEEDIEVFEIKKWKFSQPQDNCVDFEIPEAIEQQYRNLFYAGDYMEKKGRIQKAMESGIKASQKIYNNSLYQKI